MKVSEVIVVEGKNDIKAVSRAVDALVISTSGFGLSSKLIEMLIVFQQERGLIILTDPDQPGERIRSILSKHIPEAKHAFILKYDAQYRDDIGVENASVETIRNALSHLVTYTEKNSDLTYEDMHYFQLINHKESKVKREKLCNYLKITYSNGKTLLNRLHYLNMSKASLKEVMEVLNEDSF